jgi:hypothetical protein
MFSNNVNNPVIVLMQGHATKCERPGLEYIQKT